MADPTYQNDLVLLTTFIKHDSLTRMAEVTYALNDNTVNISAQAWADGCQSSFADNWKDNLDSQAVVFKTTALKGDGTSTFTTGESTAAPTRGLASQSSLPPNCAALVRKHTDVGGRKNRGRIYLPWFVNEGSVDELGNIDSADVASFQSDADDWLSDLESGGDQEFVIANRVYDRPWDQPGRKLTAVNIGEHVTALIVESVLATQRRRMPRS
jgi:hypothetical protein